MVKKTTPFETLKRHPRVQSLLPRFSRRRAFVAASWRGCRGLLHAVKESRKAVRKYSLPGALRILYWNMLRLSKNRMAISFAETPPAAILPDLLRSTYPKGLPKVSIISLLYKKRQEIPFFLEALFRQNYPGNIELILVDDICPENSAEIAKEVYERLALTHARISIKIIRNETNIGNCLSRNKGIEAATGDILIVIDADCLMNSSFVSLHCLAMEQGPFDVVIGPHNIETGHSRPLDALLAFEKAPEKALVEQKLQDPVCPTGFVNCITRNISIRASSAPLPLFDPEFSYTAAPDSGFGWEDVDMGRKLFDAGLRIAFIPGAFSLHISHTDPGEDAGKAAKSLCNFRKLLEKHPAIPLEAGRWATNVFSEIKAMAKDEVLCGSADYEAVADKLDQSPIAPFLLIRSGTRRLRILTYHWHTTHQYELFKLPHDFYLVQGIGLPFNNAWDYERRPMPANARFINSNTLREQEYDLAILPFDENVLAPENCNGVIPPRWGACFQWFLDEISLPKIGICHGTPQFHGQYDASYAGGDLMRVIESERLRLVQAVKDFLVVCNSHQAQSEWAFHHSKTIWHGLEPQEFLLREEAANGILSLNRSALEGRPHYNGSFIWRETMHTPMQNLSSNGIKPKKPEKIQPGGNLYAQAKFRNYVDCLRSYSVYFNPTQRSPMPRTRTESMLCGLATVSLRNHDVDKFIVNGQNGFYGDTPEELREYLSYCLTHPRETFQMGKRARHSACEHFLLDRFLAEWTLLLRDLSL